MVERHLRAYGPATKDDLCFYLGIRKTPLNRAWLLWVTESSPATGPDGQPMIDWDDELAPRPSSPEAARGVRLLAEFDGCLMGYAGPGRLRLLDPDQLALVWNSKNAVCAPRCWRTAGSWPAGGRWGPAGASGWR